MSKPFDFGGIHLNAGGDASSARPLEETPFCMAVLGDFSGRVNRSVFEPGSVGTRRATAIDRDNFDEVLARYKPELKLKLGEGGCLHLSFSELDDFHPDRIFEQLEAFATLKGLRRRLEDPASFRQAAEELGLKSDRPANPATASKTTAAPAVAPSAARLASGSLLDEMIEETESRPQETSRRVPDPVRDFARRVAEQGLVNSPDSRQPEVLAVMDRAIGALMGAILHNPDFQALEAIWRSTFLLVRQLETGQRLKIYLFDISKDELVADLASSPDLRRTGLYRLLVEKSVETPGAEPWSLIVGNYKFTSGKEDVALLSRLAGVADRAGAPFLGEASSRILGCASVASTPNPHDWKESGHQAAWAELRHIAGTSSIGLILPRFLLRLPYGAKTSALESFDFEEPSDPIQHEDYLWGNPAFVVALLLGQGFADSGWDMRPGGRPELAGMPLHVYVKDGEHETTPCAEVLLTEEAVESILEAGLIPLISFKNRDTVRVGRVQSIARGAKPLAGRWTG